jgi:Zn-dependent peptidase ImmA (M78 family)
LSLADLNRVCDSLGIEVVEYPLEDATGYVLWIAMSAHIYIADGLRGPEKVVTDFHELAHILYHPPHPEVFERTGGLWNTDKCQRQAEIVGVVAWMPEREVRGCTTEELMKKFGVSREVAAFRAGLRLWWPDEI